MLGREASDEGMTMVSRRGLLGGAAALAALALGGCGIRSGRLVEAIEEAANEVEGVSATTLELDTGASFGRHLHGTVSLGTGELEEGLAIFDEAMRAIVTVVHSELDEPEATGLRVGGITGVLSDGQELTPMELEPDLQAANPRLDRITAGSFYGRYGLG